jgi:hypothetical protein
MVTFQIDKITKSKTGKSLVIKAVSGETYYAKPESGLDGKAGKVIEAETSNSEYNGAVMVWVNAFKLAANQPEPGAAPTPTAGRFAPNGVNMDFILGIGKAQGRVMLLLDIDKALSTRDIMDIRAAGNSAN